MAGVLAAFGNMFAFKGSFQAEVRDWPVKGRVLRHGMEGHSSGVCLGGGAAGGNRARGLLAQGAGLATELEVSVA